MLTCSELNAQDTLREEPGRGWLLKFCYPGKINLILLSGFLALSCIAHPLVQDQAGTAAVVEEQAREASLLLAFMAGPGEIPSEGTIVDPGPGYKRIFLTQSTTDGDFSALGGGTPIENIDAFCASDGKNPDPGANWKAMIHSGASGGRRGPCLTANCSGGVSEHVDWVLAPDTEYRRVDGVTIIGRTMPALGLFDFGAGDLDASFASSGGTYWSGIGTDWTEDSNCSKWINTGGVGQLGDAGATNIFAVSGPGFVCNADRAILCVEQ